MSKRTHCVFVLALAFLSLSFSACSFTSVSVASDSPVSSSPAEVFYTVTFLNWDGIVLETDQVIRGAYSSYQGAEPVKEGDAQYSYEFRNWGEPMHSIYRDTVFTAVFDAKVNSYQVVFYNWDDSVLQSSSVAYGSAASFQKSEPVKPGNQEFSYVFNGWKEDFSFITGPTSVHADFTPVRNKYTVNFLDSDGGILDTEEVEYGSAAIYQGKEPTKRPTAQYTFAFAGWDKDFSRITEDLKVTALFTASVNSYLVSFFNSDNSFLYEVSVEYGKEAVYQGPTPLKASDSEADYVFTGWDQALTFIKGNLRVQATFAKNSKDVSFVLNADGASYAVSGYQGTSSDVSIPSVFSAKPVTALAPQAFKGLTSLTSIEIPESVLAIGAEAFAGCSSLVSLSLPGHLTEIGKGCLEGCGQLAFNDDGKCCYLGNSSNPYIVLAKIDDTQSFTVSLQAQTQFIYDRAFFSCLNLVSAPLPPSLSGIGFQAFYRDSLTDLQIPSGVSYIGDFAFAECDAASALTLGNASYQSLQLKDLGLGAFAGCSSLTGISILGSSAYFSAVDNVLYDKDVKKLLCFPGGKYDIRNLGDVILPNTVSEIGPYAFYGCNSAYFTDLAVPDRVVSLGLYAFADCTYLKNVTLGTGITAIPDYAFLNCSSLRDSIVLGANVTSIGTYAFSQCTSENFTRLLISERIVSIGALAFNGCSHLTSLFCRAESKPDGYVAYWNSLGAGENDVKTYWYAETQPSNGLYWHYSSAGAILIWQI
jgi:hypothetical protein